jgi:hypothetical protein
MSPQDKTQNDLFEQARNADKQLKRKTRFLLLDIRNSLTLSYETVIFFVIAFLMACIISFSLGVEKGRYDILSVRNRRITPPEAKRNIPAKSEPKKGATNVTTSKPKNIKLR